MKKIIKEENCAKEKRIKNVDNIEFSIAFNKDGDSFQNIMERILISKLTNSTNNG